MATVSERIDKANRLSATYAEWCQSSADEALGYRLMGNDELAKRSDARAKLHGEAATLQAAIGQALSLATPTA